MFLPGGTRLGPYEIVAPLGAGGMGEVYRATDSTLKRQVAVKILPPAMAADPDRLARFQREAEVLASLNHPRIAAVYGLEHASNIKALVMELVEGPTPRVLFKARANEYDRTAPVSAWDTTADGQRFLLLRNHESTDKPVSAMHVVLYWTDELKRRVPAK